jgi:23S rRNA pseudouridine1911/1915/1917 synthase
MAIPEMQSTDYNPPDSDEAEAVVLEVPVDLAGMRLDQVLSRLLPEYSRSRLQAWVRDGLVDVDGEAADPSRKMRGLERLEVLVQPDAEALAFVPEPMPLAIVHEDAAILVLDKPAGLVVHPAHGNWSGTLLNGLLHYCPALAGVPRGGIVHRLDKDTSGLMVVAKTLTAQTDLVRQLQARTVTREYLALVDGQLTDDGSVDAPIGRHPRDRTRMAVVPGGKMAVTQYRVLEIFPHHTLVRCSLETGRTHQIRVHMQHIGYPLTGDTVYGGRRKALPGPLGGAVERFGRQALHAARLALRHPLALDHRTWEAPMPEDMKALLDSLR